MARVFLLLLLGCWSAVGALSDSPSPGFPAPAQVYSSQEQAGGGTAVLAPNAAVQQGAAPLGPALGRVPQPEGCSAACRSQPACAWFEYCQAPAGCSHGGEQLAYLGCRLYAPTCNETVQLEPAQGLVAGFPARMPPLTVSGFATVAGQGIAGADMACSASLLPGACALRSIEEAQVVCLAAPECRAITVFLNGTDGCSGKPLSLLKTEGLAPGNAFVASGVATLQLPETRDRKSVV